jgi:hypothetical protein
MYSNGKKSEPIEEYKIASENLRWYSNIRFAQLTLFFAITALIANNVLVNQTLSPIFGNLIKMAGVFACVLFFYLELRADNYWSHFMKRAVELEQALGHKQYTERPIRKIRTTHAIRTFIFLVAVFWIITLFVK